MCLKRNPSNTKKEESLKKKNHPKSQNLEITIVHLLVISYPGISLHTCKSTHIQFDVNGIWFYITVVMLLLCFTQ